MDCKYCGSNQTEYLGAADGAGDYGEAVCDEWRCHHCDNVFDGDCIGEAVDGEYLGDEDEDHGWRDRGEIPF